MNPLYTFKRHDNGILYRYYNGQVEGAATPCEMQLHTRIEKLNSTRYIDNYKTDSGEIRWVKLGHANATINELADRVEELEALVKQLEQVREKDR